MILSIRNLSVNYSTEDGDVKAVRDVSFDLERGKTIGLVGETGAGKTTIALTIMGLLPEPPAKVISGEVEYNGTDVFRMSPKKRTSLRGSQMSMIFQDPMTSCGCFECICGVEPVSMGVVITCREHAGMTPLGMTFSEMASMTGGGVQTPGFMGHGKHFIASKKFIAAEGGMGRIVWLPKLLKDQMRDRIDATAKELYGVDNFTDMIADETICTEDPEALMNYLTEVGHPVLSMEPFDM